MDHENQVFCFFVVIIGTNYAHMNYLLLLYSYINNVHLTIVFLYSYGISSVVGIVFIFHGGHM